MYKTYKGYLICSILNTGKERPKKPNRTSNTPTGYNVVHSLEVRKDSDLL